MVWWSAGILWWYSTGRRPLLQSCTPPDAFGVAPAGARLRRKALRAHKRNAGIRNHLLDLARIVLSGRPCLWAFAIVTTRRSRRRNQSIAAVEHAVETLRELRASTAACGGLAKSINIIPLPL